MPVERKIPGAPLVPININRPGRYGLNTEEAGAILPPEWATVLTNAVFDSSGRPALRKGLLSVTGTPGAGVIRRIFEYYQADTTSELIFSTDGDIYRNVSTPVSIKGSLTITDGNIKFVNFNDKVIAFGIGASGVPAVRTTGDFASITVDSGTAPNGRVGTAAFGRLWGVDTDGKTLRYSMLLNETRWAPADGGGLIDFSNVWPDGQDTIIAITEFGGSLIVLGRNHIVVMGDDSNLVLGIDPDVLYVKDTISGVGAVSQFAIVKAAGDMWILTETGIVGLQRELVQKSTPSTNLTRHIQSEVISSVQAESNKDNITLTYSPKESLVIAVFPGQEKQFVFDSRAPMEDGTYRATIWQNTMQTLTYVRENQELYGSVSTGGDGKIFLYTGTEDNGNSFTFDYESGWLELGDQLNQYLKFIKRMTSFIFVEKNVIVSYKIAYDFGLKEFIVQGNVPGGRSAEWGTFEWGTNGVYNVNDATAVAGVDYAEWSGGIALRTLDVPGKGSGQYIKVGLTLDTDSGDFALQQFNIYAKIGRHAT